MTQDQQIEKGMILLEAIGEASKCLNGLPNVEATEILCACLVSFISWTADTCGLTEQDVVVRVLTGLNEVAIDRVLPHGTAAN